MNFRLTIVVLLIALGLGAYVYFVEIRGRESREEKRAAAARLLPVEIDNAVEVRLTQGQEQVVLARHADTWSVVAPIDAPCDPEMIRALADTLRQARREQSVGAGDRERYGLDRPIATMTVRTASGTSHRIRFGQINPLQTLVYVMVDDSDEIHLTTSALLTLALTSDFGWRDKRMVRAEPDRVHRVYFRTQQEGELTVSRDSTRVWRVEGEVAWRVDPVRFDGLLLTLCKLDAVGVAAENKEKIADFGLDRAPYAAELRDAEERTLATVIFGHQHGVDGSMYVAVPDKPEVFRVDGRLVQAIRGFVKDPRDRKVFPRYQPAEVKRIEVRAVTDKFTLVRQGVRGWTIESSTHYGSDYPIDPELVNQMLDELLTLETSGYPDAQPQRSLIEPSTMSFHLLGDKGLLSGLEVGQKEPRGLNIYCRGTDEPAVFTLSPVTLLQMPFDLERLRPAHVETPEEAERS